MLNLLDELTTEDKEKIGAYIDLYGAFGLERTSVDEILSVWAKNKTKLYHWLGNSLRVQFPFVNEDELKQSLETKVNRTFSDFTRPEYNNALRNINRKFKNYYREHNGKDAYFQRVAESNEDSLSVFPSWYYSSEESSKAIKIRNYLRAFIESIFAEHNFISGTLDISYYCKKIALIVDGKTYQFQNGEKIWKTLKKLHQIFPDAVTEKEFEDARILYSTWLNDKKKGYLTISIHPLDFMTMSDNASNWKSCMSWKTEGCYRMGSIEMMNSNNVFCVYYTSKKEDNGFSFGKYEWNDKKWRGLVIATKDIIVANKAYPYCSKTTNIAVIDKIKELAKENMGYTYEFGPELYKDMDHIMTDCYLDDVSYSIANKDENLRKNIYFKSGSMYNDMLHNMDNYEYWCYRNKVKTKKLISYSGKSECMCCGKTNILVDHKFDEGFHHYENMGSTLCKECANLATCQNCRSLVGPKNIVKIVYDGKIKTYCKNCGSNIISCPICNKRYIGKEGIGLADNCYDKKKKDYYFSKIFVIKDDRIGALEEKRAEIEKATSFRWDSFFFDNNNVYDNETVNFTPCCKECYEKALENKEFHFIKMKEYIYRSIRPFVFVTESQFKEFYSGKEDSYKALTYTNIFGEEREVFRGHQLAELIF